MLVQSRVATLETAAEESGANIKGFLGLAVRYVAQDSRNQ
jgi:hypothetical protein